MTLSEALVAIKNGSVARIKLNNKIGDGGAIALAAALKDNTTVTHIYLSENHISDIGAAALADALKDNTTITHIYLSDNNIGDIGATALVDALKNNTTIIVISLYCNYIDIVLRDQLHTLFRRNEVRKALNSRLAFFISMQNGDADVVTESFECDARSTHFDIPSISQVLLVGSLLPCETLDDFRNEWLGYVASFHLKCVDTMCDVSTPDALHEFVKAAIFVITQLDPNSAHYTKACHCVGEYFFNRVMVLEKDDPEKPAFKALALHFLSKAGVNAQAMVVQLITDKFDEVTPESTLTRQKLIDDAFAQISPAVRALTIPTLFDRHKIVTGIYSTTNHALVFSHKYQLQAVLDRLAKTTTQAAPTSATNSTFFAPSIHSCCESFWKFVTEDGTPAPSDEQLKVLNAQPALAAFFKAGRADLLAGTAVRSIAQFVAAMDEQASHENAASRSRASAVASAEPAIRRSVTIEEFREAYQEQCSREWFTMPFSFMKRNLSSITIEGVVKHAKENRNSRTAIVLNELMQRVAEPSVTPSTNSHR